jgi:methylase of polypeptide subunit release factors
MVKKKLNNLLERLELKDSGSIFFKNRDGVFTDTPLHFDTRKKLELIQPDAVYVFNNQPLVLFFDLTNKKDYERENDIHKKVWSFNNSPIIFVIKDKDINIYNALNYIKKINLLEEIRVSNEDELYKRFSFWSLQSNSTWKWLQEEYLKKHRSKTARKRVNEKLFQNIREVRRNLTGMGLPENTANLLILRLIFIRYLIDRSVEINKEYIHGATINDRRKCFCILITQPQKLSQLFEYFNIRFNGILFKGSDITIDQKQAKFLANVFSGELQGEDSIFEGYFFEIFDFSIIPVELISGIYESLINEETKKKDSAVYTPSFLVDYILNDTVDKYLESSQTSDCKIFEIAVGSGIFLVQSLRRMIEKEIELNGKANKNKFSKRIREIAKENLFGVDINEQALKVTCFSIYIALLDYLEPKDIEKYEFPALYDEKNVQRSNLFHANFFNTEHPYNEIIKSKKPHFILGNPPWKVDNTEEHTGWLNKENIYGKNKGGVEIAQSFLLRAKDFMHADYTEAALIVTSMIFYNVSSTAKIFRNKFLTTYCLNKFFDLSPVRRLIFEKKNNPASIVYFKLPRDENEHLKTTVNHLSVKMNRFLKQFKMLVIEKFDQKEIMQKHFIDNDWMFKAALYGNILDFMLLKKLKQNNNNILKLINNNKVLFKGAGIKETPPQKIPFIHLIGEKIIQNDNVEHFYSNIKSLDTLKHEDVYLQSARKEELFNRNKILIKEQAEDETHIVVSYVPGDVVYKNGVFGVSSHDDNLLKYLFTYLISDLYLYYIFCTSGSWGTSTRPQVRWNEEYLSFPLINSINEKEKSKLINLANQLLKPFEDFYKQNNFNSTENPPNADSKILSKINFFVNKLYEINDYEKDLLDYVLNVTRYQFQESKQKLLDFAPEKNSYRNINIVLKKYADVYLKEFEKIYKDEYLQAEIYLLDYFIAMNFKFSDTEPSEKIVYSLNKAEQEVFSFFANKLSFSQEIKETNVTEALFIQKDIKGFEEDSFYIIKPREYKCWHRAMAWYDVAEFMEKIEVAELK